MGVLQNLYKKHREKIPIESEYNYFTILNHGIQSECANYRPICQT